MVKKKQKKNKHSAKYYGEIIATIISFVLIFGLFSIGSFGKTITYFYAYFFGMFYPIFILLTVSMFWIATRYRHIKLKPMSYGILIAFLGIMLLSGIQFPKEAVEAFSGNYNLFVTGQTHLTRLGPGMSMMWLVQVILSTMTHGGLVIVVILIFIVAYYLIFERSPVMVIESSAKMTKEIITDYYDDYREQRSERIANQKKEFKFQTIDNIPRKRKIDEMQSFDKEKINEVAEVAIPTFMHSNENKRIVEFEFPTVEAEDANIREDFQSGTNYASEEDFIDINSYAHEFESQITEEIPNFVQSDPAYVGNLKTTETFEESSYDESKYKYPPLTLLKYPPKVKGSNRRQVVEQNIDRLEQTFKNFNLKARVADCHIGPAVTQYEVIPDPGVKVSKIVNLSDDLALALAAKQIRIEAPIPGKSAVGIEVPNPEVQMVSLRELLDDRTMQDNPEKLLVGLGRDVSGKVVSAELNKMPHLLVAGATGSGKSVCINTIITSILMRAKPSEVKFLLIDPKKVELTMFDALPHLLAPVVTDPRKAALALKKVVVEMEQRYDAFAQNGVKNIEGFNEKVTSGTVKEEKMPYIVVIIDELADLMLVASKEVEDAIMRLAQMARASGIHMIVATQRPSVDVITGVIKSNIPSRIAFGVSSQIDSRTILDMGGAEKLLGKGDMLYFPVGNAMPMRIQGAFLSETEIEKVTTMLKKQQTVQYDRALVDLDVEMEKLSKNENSDLDPLYDEVVLFVREAQKASASLLQRRFRIGYNRAARLIDDLEAQHIIGPSDGSRPREIF